MEVSAGQVRWIRARQVRQRYGNISDMSLWRRIKDPASDFPKPVKERGVRYWDVAALDRYDERLRQKTEAAS